MHNFTTLILGATLIINTANLILILKMYHKQEETIMEAEKIVVPLEVDNTELKESLKITKELNAELEKANRLVDRLTSKSIQD